MVDRQDPRRNPPATERDPTAPGGSFRATQGASPSTDYPQTDQARQDTSGERSSGMDAGQMKDRASDAAGTAREKAGEMTHTATHAVDDRRDQAAGSMDSAAQQLRERGENLPGGERTTEMAQMAADRMETTSSYIREHDVQDMMTDLETFVRSHPTQSLVAAGVAGFLVGRMLRG